MCGRFWVNAATDAYIGRDIVCLVCRLSGPPESISKHFPAYRNLFPSSVIWYGISAKPFVFIRRGNGDKSNSGPGTSDQAFTIKRPSLERNQLRVSSISAAVFKTSRGVLRTSGHLLSVKRLGKSWAVLKGKLYTQPQMFNSWPRWIMYFITEINRGKTLRRNTLKETAFIAAFSYDRTTVMCFKVSAR